MSKKINDTKKACRLKTSIGGQALIEGIMMRGPKTTAMAVRNPEGEIVLEQWPTVVKEKAKWKKLSFVRGIFNFIETLAFGYKCLMRSAEISGLDDFDEDDNNNDKKKAESAPAVSETPAAEDAVNAEMPEQAVEAENAPDEAAPEKKEKKEESSKVMNVIMVVATVLAFGLAFLLFFWLPSQLYMWMPDRICDPDDRFLKSIFEGVLRVILLVGYMSAVSLMKDIRRTYMFHGAEHKTIFCYEAGLELTVENVRSMRRFHPRCGTSFLIIMVIVSVVVGFFIPPTLPTILRVLIKVALIPLIVGIGYELIKLAGRHDNWFTRIISAPGLLLQRLTVFEPDDDMIECAITAMKEVIPEDGSDKF